MDGTLLDTRLDIARAANLARQELGLPAMTVEEVVRAVGDGVNLFVSRVTYPQSDARFNHARSVFLRHYGENIHGETKPYAGILDSVDSLHKLGYPMAIVSNKPANLVDELVDYFKWQDLFQTWLGGDSAPKAKPAADPIWLALEKMGLPESHPVIMIGDGDQDILVAKSVQARAIWCAWGFNVNPTNEYEFKTVNHPSDLVLVVKDYAENS